MPALRPCGDIAGNCAAVSSGGISRKDSNLDFIIATRSTRIGAGIGVSCSISGVPSITLAERVNGGPITVILFVNLN